MSGYPYPASAELLDRIRAADSIWLATHERPDADGYGSLLACGLALESLGKQVGVIVDDEVPAHFDALPGHATLARVRPGGPSPQLVVLFDCHRVARLGAKATLLDPDVPIVVIDHHPVDERGSDGTITWVEESAAATAVVALSLLKVLDHGRLTADQATCLYAALVTDTGGFRYENTGADTFQAASDLVAAGADAAEIAETFLHRRRPEALRLLGHVFDTVEYYDEGRIATAAIPADLLAESGTGPNETEGIISHLRSVEGVELVALAVEHPAQAWRVSLRAKPPHLVNRVARGFGGGGHAAAAAFTAEGDWSQLHERLLTALTDELRGNGSTP